MTLSTFAFIEFLALIAAAVLTAWYRPTAFQSLANGLIRFCDAIQAARAVFQAPAVIRLSTKIRPAKAADLATMRDPLFEDVHSALVNLGTPAAAAKAATTKALAAGRRDFETTFKQALQFAR